MRLWQKSNAVLAAIGVAVFATSWSASAQASGYCFYNNTSEGVKRGDVTFNGIVATDCYGVVEGNIAGQGTSYSGADILNGMAWGKNWVYVDATDEINRHYKGLNLSLSATGSTTGSWSLTGTDANGSVALNLPVLLDVVIALKAGTKYALWAFNDVVIDGNDQGTFQVVFANPGMQQPDFSHLLIFAREAAAGTINERDD